MRSIFPLAALLTGCGLKSKKLQFDLTSEQALKQVARDIEMGSELDAWLKQVSSACNAKAPSCPSMILADLEKRDYQDDGAPEYLLYDAFVERLTSPDYGITLLERDPDALAMIQMDREGVKLPTSMSPIDTTEGDDITPEDKLSMASRFIGDITSILAAQDVLLFEKEQCCNVDGTIRADFDATAIIANEVGDTKAMLIRDLVGEYLALFDNLKANEIPQKKIDVKVADYMMAYRLYRFDNTLEATGVNTERTTTLQMHVRVIDMNTGEIIVSDFLSNEMIESLKMFEREPKERTKREYAPYVSYGAGLTVANPDGVDSSPLTSPGLYGEYNYFTKNAFRLTGRGGLNYVKDDANSLNEDNFGLPYQQLAWQVGGQVTLDKVIRYNKPLQVFVGVGADVGYGNVAYTYVDGEVNEDGEWESSVGEQDDDSGLGIALLAAGGVTYNIDNLGLKAGYVSPIYSLSDGAPAQAVPMVHLGLTYSVCASPVWNQRGNTCTRDSE